MHVVIALLGSIVTILYLLDRLGVDIGWLNPFHWMHRRRWSKKFDGDPIYAVEEPMHVAALLVIGIARLDGDISAEQKQSAKDQFET
ncbi:MAG: TerB family tellurite resistance protein, partial [Pseudomonadota bacterium]